jgi:hypothetical protein
MGRMVMFSWTPHLSTEVDVWMGMLNTDTENANISLRAEVEKWVVSVGGDIDFVQSDSQAYMMTLYADKADTVRQRPMEQ